MAVIVTRGRFRLTDDGNMEPVDDCALVLADEFDGDPLQSDLTTPGDLVPFKPGADVTYLGDIHAVEPQDSILAGIQIDDHVAVLRGCGPRVWHHTGSGWALSKPDPVQSVAISYRLASGGRYIGDSEGRVDPHNPIGPGVIDPDHTPRDKEFSAPSVGQRT